MEWCSSRVPEALPRIGLNQGYRARLRVDATIISALRPVFRGQACTLDTTDAFHDLLITCASVDRVGGSAYNFAMQNTVMPGQTFDRMNRKSSTVRRYSVSSVQSAIALLEAFLRPPHQFGLTELSRMTGQTKNQTFRLLQTLADDRVVIIDPETKRYSLGYRMLEWGIVAQRSSPLVKAVSPVMDRLANDIQETIVLTALADEVSVICIDKRESSQALQISARVGRRIPLHAGAGSKCLLAYSTAEFIERFIEQTSPLPRFTARTVTDPGHLKDELRQIREQGYAVSDEDIDEGACSIAAPIRDSWGEAIAAVSVACPKTRFRDADIARNKQAVMEAADDVSRQLRQYL